MIRACRTRLGLKDAGFNRVRREKGPGYSTESRFRISYLQSQRRSVAARVPANIADRTPEEHFRPCCRYQQLHFPDCVQAKPRKCRDDGSVVVGGQRSDCAGGECNSVLFDLSSTDRSAGHCGPIAACSFQSGNAHRENIGCPASAPSAREEESYSLFESGFS